MTESNGEHAPVPPAWIDIIPQAAAPEALKRVYDRVRSGGEPSNNIRVQSMDPAALEAHLQLYRRVMFGPSPLSRALRESIAVVVSNANHCLYCITHLIAALRRVSGYITLQEKVLNRANWRNCPPLDHTVFEFAEKLTRKPDTVSESDVRALRQQGLSDEAVLHIVQLVAYFNFVNRMALGLGVSLETEE
jgi:uncharacterized peroxidase-related enzyme